MRTELVKILKSYNANSYTLVVLRNGMIPNPPPNDFLLSLSSSTPQRDTTQIELECQYLLLPSTAYTLVAQSIPLNRES
jgi:hypothetical protein